MYGIVEAFVKNERIKCVLLAAYRRDVEMQIQKKSWFRNRTIVKHEERKKYLVFVPYQHAIKEVVEIDHNELLSRDYNPSNDFIKSPFLTSRYEIEDQYYWEYEIKDFCGYEFIAKDTFFIGNVINDRQAPSLDVLYTHDKGLADLRIIP